jgi:hypothetical protein
MNDTECRVATGSDIIEEMKVAFQLLASNFADKRPRIRDEALGVITALNYGDQTLFASYAASLLSALAEMASEYVEYDLGASHGIQTGLAEGWKKYAENRAMELDRLDDVKDKFESLIDERIASMLKTGELIRSLEALGQQVDNSTALEEGIRQLRKFREDFLRRFPSSRPPSPVDREALAKAREDFGAGHNFLKKGQMVWRDKRSEKAV